MPIPDISLKSTSFLEMTAFSYQVWRSQSPWKMEQTSLKLLLDTLLPPDFSIFKRESWTQKTTTSSGPSSKTENLKKSPSKNVTKTGAAATKNSTKLSKSLTAKISKAPEESCFKAPSMASKDGVQTRIT